MPIRSEVDRALETQVSRGPKSRSHVSPVGDLDSNPGKTHGRSVNLASYRLSHRVATSLSECSPTRSVERFDSHRGWCGRRSAY